MRWPLAKPTPAQTDLTANNSGIAGMLWDTKGHQYPLRFVRMPVRIPNNPQFADSGPPQNDDSRAG